MDNFKTVITYTFPQDAYLARALLESEGIETFLKDELTVQVHNFYSNAIGGVKLQVKESDFDKGLMILKEGGYINTEKIKIAIILYDNTTNKKTCPFCQSNNIRKSKKSNTLTEIVYSIIGGISPIFKKSFKCCDCDKAWKFSKINNNEE